MTVMLTVKNLLQNILIPKLKSYLIK